MKEFCWIVLLETNIVETDVSRKQVAFNTPLCKRPYLHTSGKLESELYASAIANMHHA